MKILSTEFRDWVPMLRYMFFMSIATLLLLAFFAIKIDTDSELLRDRVRDLERKNETGIHKGNYERKL